MGRERKTLRVYFDFVHFLLSTSFFSPATYSLEVHSYIFKENENEIYDFLANFYTVYTIFIRVICTKLKMKAELFFTWNRGWKNRSRNMELEKVEEKWLKVHRERKIRRPSILENIIDADRVSFIKMD